jgi:3-oxoisoapionate decarboxylase
MKIGICAWSFTGAHREAGLDLDPHTPEGLIRLALENGLHSIECASASIEKLDDTQVGALRRRLDDNGLEIFLDTGGHDYANDVSPLETAIQQAKRVGAAAVRTTISSLLEGDRRTLGADGMQAHLKGLVAPFRRAMPLAEDAGIPVGIENHQDVCSSELIELCGAVGSPMLGVTMDVANALAVGESIEAFALGVMPVLKHVHLKDYTVHPTPSGYRLKRCALGSGVVDWPAVLALFDREAPQVRGCIELGASQARHIRILEEDYWSTYAPRPLVGPLGALRDLHRAAGNAEDWRTPHEQDADAPTRAAYETSQFDVTVAYLKKSGLL